VNTLVTAIDILNNVYGYSIIFRMFSRLFMSHTWEQILLQEL